MAAGIRTMTPTQSLDRDSIGVLPRGPTLEDVCGRDAGAGVAGAD
jgi:hypothetical protein